MWRGVERSRVAVQRPSGRVRRDRQGGEKFEYPCAGRLGPELEILGISTGIAVREVPFPEVGGPASGSWPGGPGAIPRHVTWCFEWRGADPGVDSAEAPAPALAGEVLNKAGPERESLRAVQGALRRVFAVNRRALARAPGTVAGSYRCGSRPKSLWSP